MSSCCILNCNNTGIRLVNSLKFMYVLKTENNGKICEGHYRKDLRLWTSYINNEIDQQKYGRYLNKKYTDKKYPDKTCMHNKYTDKKCTKNYMDNKCTDDCVKQADDYTLFNWFCKTVVENLDKI